MYHFGDILLIEYPYTDLAGIKQRPAVVIKDTNDSDVILARITGQSRETEFDIEITDWRSAGLLKPSIIRVHKLATLETKLIKRKLGNLPENDLKKLEQCLKGLLNM
jgi:mRNA interferase MazF